jgi:hypothetical protein
MTAGLRLLGPRPLTDGAYDPAIHNFYAPGDDLMIYVKNVKADQIGVEAAETCQSATADVYVEVPIWPKQVTGCRPLGQRFGSPCAR